MLQRTEDRTPRVPIVSAPSLFREQSDSFGQVQPASVIVVLFRVICRIIVWQDSESPFFDPFFFYLSHDCFANLRLHVMSASRSRLREDVEQAYAVQTRSAIEVHLFQSVHYRKLTENRELSTVVLSGWD